MDLDPYLGSALPTGVALAKAASFPPSHFISKKKVLMPRLPGGEDLSYRCHVPSTESGP